MVVLVSARFSSRLVARRLGDCGCGMSVLLLIDGLLLVDRESLRAEFAGAFSGLQVANFTLLICKSPITDTFNGVQGIVIDNIGN